MWQKQIYSIIRNIVALTFIISRSSGLIYASFNCSNYTFHGTSNAGRSWETSRSLCQKSSEGDLVSIEQEEERNFVKNIIKNLTTIKYFIGLKKDNGKWKWLSNQTTVNSSQGESPWAPREPSGTPDRKDNCATIYGIYLSALGLFDDMSCIKSAKDAGYICERAVSCTKDETDAQATKERQRATSVLSTARTPWKTQLFPSTAEIDSIAPGSKLKIQRCMRQGSSIKLKDVDSMSPAEQEMDAYGSLSDVKRQDACVTTKEGVGGLFLSIQESSARRPKEALIEEQSYTNSYSDPLHISATTKPSKVLVKKDTPEQHQVYVHIHSKQEKTAFHLDHAIQHLGEEPSQVTVDKKNCKPSAAISSARLEKELTRDEDAIVKQSVSGQDQCIDCVYAVVDKTKKKGPPTKPAPYQELVYVDLSHSPKKSKNERIHQESTASIYADIDHFESSALSDSNSQQEYEVELTE
ncbi:uncharacterized protein [Acropora muricata]|uniref:uncharacterized protein isoform X3 n=1 Tax=Acropora muricata TaxID=159855 RepID=UPI0034E5C4E9